MDRHFEFGIEIPNESFHERFVGKERDVGEIAESDVDSERVIAEIRNFDEDLPPFLQYAVEMRDEASDVLPFHMFEDMAGNDEIHASVRHFR